MTTRQFPKRRETDEQAKLRNDRADQKRKRLKGRKMTIIEEKVFKGRIRISSSGRLTSQ